LVGFSLNVLKRVSLSLSLSLSLSRSWVEGNPLVPPPALEYKAHAMMMGCT